ncbi:PulJ/GspJ family protein [Acinetobacter sp. PW68]|uniref:PulJ/GspJ family protein n=1 Tax=Acinetobacter sp. PW68 TaxID=2865162 RepID=UPI001E4ADF31|nr:prepilin-type N-terminal cleavage/methylation domain-containing protein [Acinetobacter sp. PW68]MCD0188981.1 prepilin-type N-terminal cleavage/methylation domain-containing protein [Acinetobacter sp. PW68]
MLQLQHSSKYQHQAGITLIEVLISLLLMAIIGLGGAYIAARTAVVQRDGNIQLQTINKMRQVAVKADTICSNTSSITINGTSVTTPCTLTPTTYTVNASINSNPPPTSPPYSASVTVQSPSIQVSDSDQFVPVKSIISP